MGGEMCAESVSIQAMNVLTDWFTSFTSPSGGNPRPYVICAGLAVLERMRQAFPLPRTEFITPGNQVRTSGGLIRNILERHGEHRRFTAEGGRTTRGTVPASEKLADALNGIDSIRWLTDEERETLLDDLQTWLVERVKDYFRRQRIKVEVNIGQPSPRIVADIIEAAGRQAGAVTQHLVGAKLAVRFPNLTIENFSYTTADEQLGRPGDFVVRDTAFHVTVAPMPPVIEKCRDNLRNDFRPLLLVPVDRLLAARQMADNIGVGDMVDVAAVEEFVGHNIEEIGEFSRANLGNGLRRLLEKYNERVSEVEPDPSLLIEVPSNL